MNPAMRTHALLLLILASFGVSNANAGLVAEGDIVVADPSSASIIKVDPITGAQTVISSGGLLVAPLDIAIDENGDLLVADKEAFGAACPGVGCGGVIRIDGTTGAQTEITSGGHFVKLKGIVIDSNGDLLVSDDSAFGLRGGIVRVDPITGSQSVVSSGGIFVDPQMLALDLQGDIVLAEGTGGGGGFNGSIIIVDPQTGAQNILAAGGHFVTPLGVIVDQTGDIFVAEAAGKIVRVDRVFGNQSLVASGGFLSTPAGIDIDVNGDLLVADSGRIIQIDPLTGGQTVLSTGGYLVAPFGLTIVPANDDAVTATEELISIVINMNLQQGISNSLDAKLEAVLQALDDANENNDVAMINMLVAFIQNVEAQRGNKLTDVQADELVAAAQAIIDQLSA